jgi:hypothetical protein
LTDSITTEKELGSALKNEIDTIEIKGDLANKIVKIRATGKVAWGVAAGAIAVAILITVASGGTAAPASSLVGVAAVSILGLSAATTAVLIGVSAGGISALNRLRKYKEIERSDGRLVLAKK